MSDRQVELIAAALAEVDGHDIDTLESERQERYRERARAASARLNSGRGKAVDVETMARRREVMRRAFTEGVPMERAMREAEPDLTPGYVSTLLRTVYDWDRENGGLLRGSGHWDRTGNEGVQFEVVIRHRGGRQARWRFSDLTDAEAWLRTVDEEWSA